MAELLCSGINGDYVIFASSPPAHDKPAGDQAVWKRDEELDTIPASPETNETANQ
jgi:hypothetical protein